MLQLLELAFLLSSYYSILQLLELALYYIIVFILKQKNHYYVYSIPLVGFEYSLQAIKIQSEPCLTSFLVSFTLGVMPACLVWVNLLHKLDIIGDQLPEYIPLPVA